MQNFINQFDPSKDLSSELDGISLERQYNSLTEREKKLVFLKINGFNRMPPSIEQLYTDTYYLGSTDFYDGGKSIYQFWKTELEKIFPTEVTTSAYFLILSGAIGIGKSTISRLCMANCYSRMLCMRNPSKTLHLIPKPFSFVVTHKDESVGYNEFIKWFKEEALEKSPFFKNVKPNFKLQYITSGPLGGKIGLGSDVLVYILSELNFYPNPQRAQSIVESAYGRVTSRFNSDAMRMVGNLIIDSSAKGDNSATEWFLNNSPKELTYYCHPAHYEVKPQDYKDSKGVTFPIYVGDGKYPNQILGEDYRLMEDQDPERVIHVPIQLKIEAKQNLEKMLQDKCGISTTSSDLFFNGSVEKFARCMNKPNLVPEIIKVDFYDMSDRLIDILRPAINQIPRGTTIWLGLDLARVDDYASISATQFDHWKYIGDAKFPVIKSYFTVAISRKDGQETSLRHIFDFIMALKSEGYNLIVSADQAYSAEILQDCERENIETRKISTDNVPCQPALYLKNLILQGLISLPLNKRLLREAYDLRYVPMKKGYKVDHPAKATDRSDIFDDVSQNPKGSKDCWDSLAESVYSLKMSIDAGEEDGYSNGVDKQMSLIKEMTQDSKEDSSRAFQNMLESIWDL